MKKENQIVGNEVSVNPLESIEFNENEYKKLLQQTVEVIEHSRIQVAKQVNTTVTSSYWEIGKLLTELKIDSKYGDHYVKIIKRIKKCNRLLHFYHGVIFYYL